MKKLSLIFTIIILFLSSVLNANADILYYKPYVYNPTEIGSISGVDSIKFNSYVPGTTTSTLYNNSGALYFGTQPIGYPYTPENVSNKAINFLTVNDTLYPSVQAVKTYTDALVAGLLDYRGGYDASGNTYPTTGGSGTEGAVVKGDTWVISIAGTLGGVPIHIGDTIIANVDTPGQTSTNWNTLNTNIGYVPEDVENKVTSISEASTDIQYPSAKLFYDKTHFTTGSILFAGSDGFPSQNNANFFYDSVNQRLNIGTNTGTSTINMGGDTSRLISMNRRTTSGAGSILRIIAGGAYSGGTDLNGGSLILNSGTANGTGSSYISLATATPGTSGTTDRTATEKVKIDGIGDVDLSGGGKLKISGTQVSYLPNQTNFTGSLIYGNGGTNLSHTTGNEATNNTIFGIQAGNSITIGYNNTIFGTKSLFSNTSGNNNSTLGESSLYSNTSGYMNNAFGGQSLYKNTVGYGNSVFGFGTMGNNINGSLNISFGIGSLSSNVSGNSNSGLGGNSLEGNTSGSFNLGAGRFAGAYIANGTTPNQTTNNSVYLGSYTKASADGNSNENVIGYDAIGNGSNSVTIGNDSIVKTVLKGKVGIQTSTPVANFDATPTTITTTTYTRPFPALTLTQRNALTGATAGVGVFNSTNNVIDLWNGTNWVSQNSATNVYVNDISDLPASSGGKITLAAYTNYIFSGLYPITTTDEIVLSHETSIQYATITCSKITFTGSALIRNANLTLTSTPGLNYSGTVANRVIRIEEVNLIAATTTQFLSMSSTQPYIFILREIAFAGAAGSSFGTVSNCKHIVDKIDAGNLGAVSSGITFSNNYGMVMSSIDIPNGGSFASSAAMFTWTGTSQGSIELNSVNMNNSGTNVSAFKFDTVTTFGNQVRVIGGGITDSTKKFTSGSYTQATVGFKFLAVGNISDSTTQSFSGFENNATSTTITNNDTCYKINATWTNVSQERITFSADGTGTYVGNEAVNLNGRVFITLDPATATDTVWTARIRKNGNPISYSKFKSGIKSGEVLTFIPEVRIDIVKNDTIDVCIERNTGTGDVVVTDGKFIIEK